MSGVELIAEERRRQVEVEGWTPEHDQGHVEGELALVAALYATPIPLYSVNVDDDRKNERTGNRGVTMEADDPWPAGWGAAWDKRGRVDRIRLLVMAGALIAAEIDRLQGEETPC